MLEVVAAVHMLLAHLLREETEVVEAAVIIPLLALAEERTLEEEAVALAVPITEAVGLTEDLAVAVDLMVRVLLLPLVQLEQEMSLLLVLHKEIQEDMVINKMAAVAEVILQLEELLIQTKLEQAEREQQTELEELLLTQSLTRVEVEEQDIIIHQDARQVAQVEVVKVVLELKEQEKLELVILAVEVDLALDLELIWGELEDQVSLF